MTFQPVPLPRSTTSFLAQLLYYAPQKAPKIVAQVFLSSSSLKQPSRPYAISSSTLAPASQSRSRSLLGCFLFWLPLARWDNAELHTARDVRWYWSYMMKNNKLSKSFEVIRHRKLTLDGASSAMEQSYGRVDGTLLKSDVLECNTHALSVEWEG